MSHTGSCLCGAVTYTVTADITHAGACHCSMCRKFSGGVYIGIAVPPDGITVEGADNITTFTSSDWAERGFCGTCGSSIFYRVTAPGPYHGTYHIGMGSLNDTTDITVTEELFTDLRPKGYALAGELKGMTMAEVEAMFASIAEEN